MSESKIKYEKLCEAKVSDNRTVVISNCTKGGYTIAQRLDVSDGKSVVSVFLKGAIHVKDKEALENLRNGINMALDIIENGTDHEMWDNSEE